MVNFTFLYLIMHIIIHLIIYWGQRVIICTGNISQRVLIGFFQNRKIISWLDLSRNYHYVLNVQLVGLRTLYYNILYKQISSKNLIMISGLMVSKSILMFAKSTSDRLFKINARFHIL